MEIMFAFCLSATAHGALLNSSYEPHTGIECVKTDTWIECEILALAAIDANTDVRAGGSPLFDIIFCSELEGDLDSDGPVLRQEIYLNTQ